MPTNLSLVPAASSPIKFPAPASDSDFNWSDTATAIGTSTGTTTISLAGVVGTVRLPSKITGSGVPANTYLISQNYGTPGGNGAYSTNNPTTLAGITLSLAASIPIEPDGNPQQPIVVNPGTVIPGETFLKITAGHDYTLVLPTFAYIPLVQGVKFNLSAVPPWKTAGVAPQPTPPPLLTMTRTPPFPAYPS